MISCLLEKRYSFLVFGFLQRQSAYFCKFFFNFIYFLPDEQLQEECGWNAVSVAWSPDEVRHPNDSIIRRPNATTQQGEGPFFPYFFFLPTFHAPFLFCIFFLLHFMKYLQTKRRKVVFTCKPSTETLILKKENVSE